MNCGKQGKKKPRDIVNDLRKFLNGEDIAERLLQDRPQSTVIFLPLNNRDAVPDFSEINFYTPELPERKTYPDPDIEGINYVYPETLKDIESSNTRLSDQPIPYINPQPKIEPVEQPENNVQPEPETSKQRFIIHRGRKIPLDEFSWAHEAWIKN